MSTLWTILVNPRSGRGVDITDRTKRAVARHEIDGTVVAPEGVDAMREAVREAVAAGCRHIAAVGGDGTLSLVVDELMRLGLDEPPVVAVVPAGSGSDFARIFAISQSIEGSITHLNGTTDYPVDVGFVEGEWGVRAYINVAQAGLLASCVALAHRLPRSWGAMKYQIAFWMTLPRYGPSPIRCTTDRRTYEGSALLAVFANGQFFGGGFNIAPKSAVMDGLLDAQFISAARWRALELFPKIRRGLHLRHKAVTRYRTKTFSLTTHKPWVVEVDGDVIGSTPMHGWVEQGRLLLRL